MGAQSLKRRYWLSLFEEKASRSDVTVKEFCIEKHVSEKSYWYFHKALSDELEERIYGKKQDDDLPLFLELNKEDLHPAIMTCNDHDDSSAPVLVCSKRSPVSVKISDDISDEFLIRIMRALNNV